MFKFSNLSIEGETNIEGCEYFMVKTYSYSILIHKGNCKNPIHHYIQKIEFDSMKINLLENQIKILENTNKQLFYQLKPKNNGKN